ncbi:hypothetical protein [Paenibacillus sabinae]|uniref:DUF4386 domain-containing protein n=1 Tax=Paenibacillus sabinae T27 TaxID=1268072 RepID=X4ZLN2_9BACL|nr:hypothetical protein [Paenibacillus sabinae]AHV98172.1 hypothetical protein PSAB_16325 [Paenibacillus sabinae T27]
MKQKTGVIKFGGITLIISGILFFAQYLFVLPIFSPPLADANLMTWLQDWRFNFAMADELLIFATLCLIPSIAALYRILVKVDKIKTLLGCSLLAVVIPINVFLVIILGRLAYPVYDMELSPTIYKLVLSTYYGGTHCVAIILSMATIILCLVIRKSVIGKSIGYLGFVVGILDFIGSYPWLIGTAVLFVSQLFFSAWFVILGMRMLSRSEEVVALDCNN